MIPGPESPRLSEIELHAPLFPSSAVHSFGWEPIKSGAIRGNIHIQFHKDGILTSRGYFKAVQRSIYAGLEAASKPGAFIHQNLRNHFEWVRTDLDDFDTATLPDDLYIPADVANTVEAITACIDSQRIQATKTSLFD